MLEHEFKVAGAELDWPVGTAAGMANHPDIEVVARDLEQLADTGVSFVTAGSWTVGDINPGNAFEHKESGWDYHGGDEFVDLENRAAFNSKKLANPGTEGGIPRLPDLLDVAHSKGVELVLSLSPHGGDPLGELIEIVRIAEVALEMGVLKVEVNLSCPNVEGRPPFYKDGESLMAFFEQLEGQNPLLNKYGQLGLDVKYGPLDANDFYSSEYLYTTSEIAVAAGIGGVVSSNTLLSEVPADAAGEPVIKFNQGRAGKSGPAMQELGRQQQDMWVPHLRERAGSMEFTASLGVGLNGDVPHRLKRGAAAAVLGSAIRWPELVECSDAGEVVDKVKGEIVDSFSSES